MEIRYAHPDETTAVGALTEAGYRADGFLDGKGGVEDDYGDTLRNAADRAQNAELLVMADGPSLLGTVTWCPVGSPYRELATRDDQGEFRMLAVAPTARRRGVGRLLVQWCIERANADSLREIVMCSMTEMTSAHALYSGLGFGRAPELDWRPVPHVLLLGFRLALGAPTTADGTAGARVEAGTPDREDRR
ncbi:MAG: GNAT family N-acetyltransferase [Nocardioidaceae bacterium]